MKKKVAVIVLAVIMAFSCSFGLTACGGNGEGGEHTHTYSQQWTSDETNHWHVCTECGEAEEKSPHKFGENNICEICGYERQQEEHVHAKPGDADYVITESTHGYTCSCGVVITEEHTFGADGKCTVCGYSAHKHSRPDGAQLTQQDTGHSYVCSCGETIEEAHSFDTDNTCTVCGYVLTPSTGLAFTENEDGYTLSGIGEFTGTELRIPYYYNGRTVTGIEEKAFSGNTQITALLIPDSVSAIGASAFEDCTALTAVTLGAGLSSLKDNIFKNCSVLEEVIISENCTTLGNHIQATSNPGQYLFRNCKALKSIDIPASVTGIGNYAFWNCTSLETITGAEGLRYVGREIAGYTPFADNDDNYESGVLYVGASAIDAKDDITSATLRSGTISVARSAFWNNEVLASVTLPESVAVLGYYAFYNCPALTKISLPSTLATVYYYVFDESTNIKTVEYAGNLHGWHSIKWYDEITPGYDLYLGGKLAGIEYTSTADGHSYACPTCGETITGEHVYGSESACVVCGYAWDKEINGSFGLEFELNDDGESYTLRHVTDKCKDKDIVIPAVYNGKPVTKIGKSGYYGVFYSYTAYDEINSVTIPDSVTAIDDYGFSYSKCKISEMVIPNTVTYIGDSAFPGSEIGSLTFEEGSTIETIKEDCFFAFTSSELRLPDSVKVLGKNAFHAADIDKLYLGKNFESFDTSRLYSTFTFANINVIIDEANPYLMSKGNCIIRKSDGWLLRGFNNSVIPDDGSVKEIGYRAFMDLDIETITIPSSVKVIHSYAFGDDGTDWQECPLKSVVFKSDGTNGTQIIGYRAFRNCELLTDVQLPDTLLTIGKEAFYNCGIERITIPASVNAVYENAFKTCPISKTDDMTAMTFEKPDVWYVTRITYKDGVLTDAYIPTDWQKYKYEDIANEWNLAFETSVSDRIVVRDLELFKQSYDTDHIG